MNIVTSAGILKNVDKPRVGVTNRASSEFVGEVWANGIDLGYEAAYEDTLAEVTAEYECGDAGPNFFDETDITDEVSRRLEFFESNGPFLIGDWIKNQAGQYEPDTNGPEGFAATYDSETGIVCVEWSRTVRRCHYTSPCYVMADGSGPCGDLDTAGDSVLAYALPDEYMQGSDE